MKALLILMSTILAFAVPPAFAQPVAASTIDRGQAKEFSQAEIYQ